MNKEAAKNRSRENDRRIVVLDDDPTGTQTVSDVEVMLVPDQTAFRRFLASGEKALFVLTNTRALPTSQAVLFLRRIREAFDREAADAGCRLAYVLRGDSTLRGHVFPEMDVFSSANSVGLFVPAFPECGRLTIGGIQWLEDGRGRRPVSETEYAKDPVFGYQSRS